MNKHEDRAKEYLLHVLEALDKISKYTSGLTREDFLENPLVQDAVLRNIGIVGEAAKQLLDVAPEFSRNHPDIPFAEIYGMRNRVIHGYASVNPEVVWDCIREDISALRGQVMRILAGFLG